MIERIHEGHTAIVTGAAGVLGMATTRALIDRGAKVIMVDIDQDGLDQLSAELGEQTIASKIDLRDANEISDSARRLLDEFGGVDILVNNAGILSNNKSATTTPAEWRNVLSINLDAALYLSQAVLPGMRKRKWGRIVNTCSLAGKTGGLTAGTAYSTSKGALAALTFSLAREVAGDGVTANGIAPAYVKTPMVTEQLTEAQRQDLLKQIPVGRFCEPEEFAHTVSFLTHPLAGFITGEIVDLNGGLLFD
jgi:3-oxoacyl-[acyl-carrier protein] reductase